jgi:beta-glucanase (GH16 family)
LHADAAAPPATHAAASPPYLFDDEFNGTSLDLSKWQPNWLGPNNTAITKPVNGQERSCYDPAQVSESGGALHLTAVARTCSKWEYASGLVNTKQHFTFRYGYIEARVWLQGSSSTSNWPAVWANGTGKWPKTGEIDVMEGLGGKDCYHFHSKKAKGPGGCANIQPPSGWHTFAADWRKDRITYYYDGNQVGTVTSGLTSAPMYLIMNLGLSSSISPPIVAPASMAVDYIRVSP